MLKTVAIKEFLKLNTEPDLAELYNESMETQVNVAQDNGTATTGESKGHQWRGWTDGQQTWKMIRIPWNAKSNPEYQDSELRFSMKHFEGIGLTGWDWKNKKSIWVGFDFDSITNHKQGLSDQELVDIKQAVMDVEWVSVRKSTSGAGLHLYVFLDNSPEVATHTEHAALARAILGLLSARIGFKLEGKVDVCGHILWFWHRRKKPGGFTLVKANSTKLSNFPLNWKDHVPVIERKQPRVKFNGDMDVEKLMTRTRFKPLNSGHKKLLAWFEHNKDKYTAWWDSDRYMLVCHTYALKIAHRELNLIGIYDTIATGKDIQNDQNCFCFPLTNGWMVRRHTKKSREHPMWEIDNAGWTRCPFDAPTDLGTAARSLGGAESEKGRFIFKSLEYALRALEIMGLTVEEVPLFAGRAVIIKEFHDGRIALYVDRNKDDLWLDGWFPENRNWVKIVRQGEVAREIETPDENARHLVSNGEDAGWYFRARDEWIAEDRGNIMAALGALGIKKADAAIMLGNCVLNYWTFVCEPFKPEYPGDRKWNRGAPQYAAIPKPGAHPHWDLILNHIGAGINEAVEDSAWCRDNSVASGYDWLKLWLASLFQFPDQPLPYLFLYSPEQNTGKTTFSESIRLLLKEGKGAMRADNALTSQGRYNAELANAILCCVEETDLKAQRDAYNRIKDWVTGRMLLIHEKYGTPYEVPNRTHWVQTSNNKNACPIFPGDTRIVVIRVKPFVKEIPRQSLSALLKDEVPYFLETLLTTEIPPTNSRLRVPVVTTDEKIEAENANRDPVTLFFLSHVYNVEGHSENANDLYKAFYSWLEEPLKPYWNEKRFLNAIPDTYIKGRYKHGNFLHIGNVSLNKDALPCGKLVKYKDRLTPYDVLLSKNQEKLMEEINKDCDIRILELREKEMEKKGALDTFMEENKNGTV